MLEVKLFDLGTVNERENTHVVCVSRYKGKWVYCRKKRKNTWEIHGGHIENGENWTIAARRELFEEAGIVKAKIQPICSYKISTYAILCFAEVMEIGDLPNYEMEQVRFFDNEPQNLTYPDAHKLFLKVIKEKKHLI